MGGSEGARLAGFYGILKQFMLDTKVVPTNEGDGRYDDEPKEGEDHDDRGDFETSVRKLLREMCGDEGGEQVITARARRAACGRA